MKKFLTVILSLCVLLSFSMFMISCKDDNGNDANPQHEHSFSTQYTKDGTHHWFICEGEDCSEISGKAEHNFTEGVCSDCGYEKPSEPTHEHSFSTQYTKDETHHWFICEGEDCSEISGKAEHNFTENVCADCGYERPADNPPIVVDRNQVTAEQFNSALSEQAFLNVTLQMSMGDGGAGMDYTWDIDGNKMKTEISDEDFIYEKTADKLYAYVYMDLEAVYTGWVRAEVNLGDELSTAYATCNSVKALISQINASDCEYEEGYYVCAQTMYEGTSDEANVNIKIRFNDGVLLSISFESVDNPNEVVALNFSNFGTTSVTLPTEFMDITELSPTPSSGWEDYFVFDNVSATLNQTITMTAPYETVIPSTSSIKIDGAEWLFEDDGSEIYYDGVNVYVGGQIAEDTDGSLYYSGSQFLVMAEMFAYYESIFTETSTGVFEADELIVAVEVGSYKDLKIVIVDGKIQSLEYSMDMNSGEMVAVIEYVYTFSDWGETVIEYTVGGGSSPSEVNWEDLFVFDNVTISSNYDITYYEEEIPTPVTMQVTFKIEDEKWSSEDDTGYKSYFDGETLHESGSNLYGIGYDEFLSNILIYKDYGVYFTEIDDGEYLAETFMSELTNVRIITVDGKISELSFEYEGEISSTVRVEQTVTFTFTDWGNTVADSVINN